MIARIHVGSGTNRTTIEPTRDRDIRRTLGNKIKGALFATNAAYHAAKARGANAMVPA